MITYKELVFTLFGKAEKRQDINKDANDKGTYERYNEVVGEDIDNYIKPPIDGMLDNLINPDTIQTNMINFRLLDLAAKLTLGTTPVKRRAVYRHLERWDDIRGTKRMVRLLFGMIKMDVTITETWSAYGWDSDVTLDDESRIFDEGCRACSDYSLALVGTDVLDDEKYGVISSIVNYNHPINAKLTGVTYNANNLTVQQPSRANNYLYQITE